MPAQTNTQFLRFFDNTKKVVAVGLNYRSHAKEMGKGDDLPTTPLLFLKPSTALVTEGHGVRRPPGCKELHHEVELGVVIGRRASCVTEEDAMDTVAGYVLCLDMTARDMQQVAKNKGQPWSLSKGFDTSCPVGSFIPKEAVKDVHNLNIWCKVNGKLRQSTSTSDMIFKVPRLISYISQYFTLEENDLILTGTPAGVSAVSKDDEIEAGIEGYPSMKFIVEN